MTTRNRAAIRRRQAIGSLVDSILSESNSYNPVCTAERAAELIRTLAHLGRTARWLRSIESWAAMVEEDHATDDQGHLRWAVLQGSAYASHAAD